MFTTKHTVTLQMVGKLPSVGWDSAVGIAAGRSGDRIPVGKRFSAWGINSSARVNDM